MPPWGIEPHGVPWHHVDRKKADALSIRPRPVVNCCLLEIEIKYTIHSFIHSIQFKFCFSYHALEFFPTPRFKIVEDSNLDCPKLLCGIF